MLEQTLTKRAVLYVTQDMLDEFEWKLAQEETRLGSGIDTDENECEAPEKASESVSSLHPNSRSCGKCFNCTKANCGQCAVCRKDMNPKGEFVTNICLQKVCESFSTAFWSDCVSV